MSRQFIVSIGAAFAAFATAAAAPAYDWKADARALYADAIGVPTVLGRDTVPELAGRLAERYRQAGWPAEAVRIIPYDRTAALIATWPGSDRRLKPIVLMAHMDVVEARREDWTVDPFALTERDGYFYGRGTSDDKQGVVGITSALFRLRAEGFRPRRGITVLFTGDEETGGRGAELAATEWPEVKAAAFVVNGDVAGGARTGDGRWLGYGIQAAEKSYMTFTFTVRNRGGHSSLPRADNAIYQLAEALGKLSRHSFTPAINPVSRAYFAGREKLETGPLGDAMRAWLANPNDRAAADRIEQDESERGLTRTTCVATRLAAGHADNALPGQAVATVNCRVLPGIAAEAVRLELVETVADPQVEIAAARIADSGPASALDPAIVGIFARAINQRHPGVPLIPLMSQGATDGAPLRAHGIPVYGFDGAWRVVPDDLREHGRDERLAVASFYDNVDIWRNLLIGLTR